MLLSGRLKAACHYSSDLSKTRSLGDHGRNGKKSQAEGTQALFLVVNLPGCKSV